MLSKSTDIEIKSQFLFQISLSLES